MITLREFLADCFILFLRVLGFYILGATLIQHVAHGAELSKWRVTEINDGRHHQACSAEREVAPGVFAEVWLPSDGSVLKLSLTGVNFGNEDGEGGLIAIDDNDPTELYVTHLSPWKNEMFVSPHDKNLFSQLANGRKLYVLVAETKYAVDLAGSAQMLRDLQTCNANGQRLLNRKRMGEAMVARSRMS